MAEEETGTPKDGRAAHRDASVLPGGTILCEVFRSPRREGMYLYVERSEGLARVPNSLMERFGTAESAMVFRLHSERRLARAAAADVLEALKKQGFYLQMPPAPGGGAKDSDADAQPERSSPVAAESVATPQPDGEGPSC